MLTRVLFSPYAVFCCPSLSLPFFIFRSSVLVLVGSKDARRRCDRCAVVNAAVWPFPVGRDKVGIFFRPMAFHISFLKSWIFEFFPTFKYNFFLSFLGASYLFTFCESLWVLKCLLWWCFHFYLPMNELRLYISIHDYYGMLSDIHVHCRVFKNISFF